MPIAIAGTKPPSSRIGGTTACQGRGVSEDGGITRGDQKSEVGGRNAAAGPPLQKSFPGCDAEGFLDGSRIENFSSLNHGGDVADVGIQQ